MNMAADSAYWGALGAVLGYVLSLWRSRIVPWISLIEISEIKRESDEVTINERLRNATAASWFMEELTTNKPTVQNVYECVASAKVWLTINRDSERTLAKAIDLLKVNSTAVATQDAVSSVLGPKGLSDMIEMALKRQVLKCEPDMTKPVCLPVDIVSDKGGRFAFALASSILYFGSKLEKEHYAGTRLQPFVDIVSRLDAERILKAFEGILPLLREQAAIHREIEAESAGVVERQARWMAEVTISNIGSGPFAVFPVPCFLQIRGGHIKPFKLPCNLIVKDEDGDWVPAKGVQVVAPGSILRLGAATTQVQGEIDGGDHLRDAFRKGNATARLRLTFLGKDIPWKRGLSSTPLRFATT